MAGAGILDTAQAASGGGPTAWSGAPASPTSESKEPLDSALSIVLRVAWITFVVSFAVLAVAELARKSADPLSMLRAWLNQPDAR